MAELGLPVCSVVQTLAKLTKLRYNKLEKFIMIDEQICPKLSHLKDIIFGFMT